ncbi:RNA-directed DNA polymerase, eukaryota [Tanacetum coccineum]
MRGYKQVVEDDGWVKVNKRHQGGIKDNKKNISGHSRFNWNRLSDFDMVMKDLATSLFFTKFLDSWDVSALWKMFCRYGKVVDVYVAFKRMKLGSRFGFVRFINIGEIVSFENRLKGITIGETKIVINRAKFIKVAGKGVPVDNIPKKSFNFRNEDFPPFSEREPNKNLTGTYKDVVGSSKSHTKSTPTKCIEVEKDEKICARLNNCWIGRAENFEDANCESCGRLAWINLEGLPIIARNFKAITTIAKEFGNVLEVRRLDFDSPILQHVNILVLVPSIMEINQVINVKLNGKLHPVKVFEDRRHTLHLISSHLPYFFSQDIKSKCFPNDDGVLDSNDNIFEEEFVGPTVDVNGGENLSGEHWNKVNNNSTPFDSGNSLDHVDPIDNSNSNIVIQDTPFMDHAHEVVGPNIGPNFSREDNLGLTPDLNSQASQTLDNNVVDKDLDELFSSFQRMVDSSNNIQPLGNIKKGTCRERRSLLLELALAHLPLYREARPDVPNWFSLAFICFQMKGISLNCNGFGSSIKKNWVSDIVKADLPIFFGIQETKLEHIDSCLIRSIWSNLNVDFAFCDSTGALGGILTISHKEALWLPIELLINSINAIWIIFGDFNVVRSRDERAGSNFDQREASAFNDFIARAGLFNFPLGGRKFTRFDKGSSKLSKLDRFLVSHNFFGTWNNASVTVLCRTFSDHCPILISCGLPDFGPKPFKIFDKWIGNMEMLDVISNSWSSCPVGSASLSSDLRLKNKIKKLRQDIRTWTSNQIATQNHSKNELFRSLVDWDNKAECGLLTTSDIDKGEEWLMDLQALE